MGRAEMILLIAAIAILGRYSLTVNDALAGNETRVLQSEFALNAVSIAEQIFQQAWLRSYDENTVSGPAINIPGDFTVHEHMGPDGSETYPDFDDIDDYDGLSIVDTAGNGMTYKLTVTVGYIDASDKDAIITTRSDLKRMDVTVASDYLMNSITLTRLFPYWK